MRVLHLGNIANNAYNNAKILRSRGVDARVLVYDYDHVMGHPEWEDAPIDVDLPERFTGWTDIDLGGFERPTWFQQVTLRPPKEAERFAGQHRLVSIARRVGHTRVAHQLLRRYGDGANRALRFLDILRYLEFYPRFCELLAGYDLIQAYATDPIRAMLAAPDTPLVAFEHGTMRDVPFEPTPTGRLLSVAYRHAAHVIITNPDVVTSAQRLGLERYTFVPHPLDETKYRPGSSPRLDALRAEHDCDLVLFAPSRHNWEIKGNDRILRAVARLVHGGRRQPLLILCDWGQQMDRSRRLVDELEIGRHVVWVPPLGKMKMIDFYNGSDVVLDQFVIGTFGTVTPEAMATATPVIIHFDPEIHRWCYETMPPVVRARTTDEICERLVELYDPVRRRAIGEAGRDWICEYHGRELVASRLLEIYERACS
jgi:glycosyltransferase involved in cell wall biosynthesis